MKAGPLILAIGVVALLGTLGLLGYRLAAGGLAADPSGGSTLGAPASPLAASTISRPSASPGAGIFPTNPATGDKTIPPNPCAGLSDAQCEALHAQWRQEWEQRYTAWVNNLDLSKVDLGSLSRGKLAADYAPGEPSLRAAVAKADLIVVGSVVAFNPTPFSGLPTTLSVDQTLKGPESPTVVVTQAGLLEPDDNWTTIRLVEAGSGAILLPGDRAILLLEKTRLGYEIQSVSGWYQVVDGLVRSNRENTWGSSVDGLTEAAFVQQLRAALQ